MAIKNKAQNILKLLLNDIAEIFPLLFLFYVTTFFLSLLFESWRLYFNWPLFHVNILILGLFSFLSEHGREKFTYLKSEIIRIIMEKRQIKPRNIIEYFILTIRKAIVWMIKILIKVASVALDIRHSGAQNHFKFLLLALMLGYATFKGAGVIELLIIIYAFRVFFIGINSRLSARIALTLLLLSPLLLIMQKPAIAEKLATFAFYFLIFYAFDRIMRAQKKT